MGWAMGYASRFPMAPIGGLFLATVGIFILLGAFVPRIRLTLTYIGFAVGTIALVLGGRLAVGLPHPTATQVGALVLAIALEVIAFGVIIPRVRERGERALIVATLAIVGCHFIVMLPAFGPLIGALGALCALNAALLSKRADYRIEVAWLINGAMKLAVGALLVATSPLVQGSTRSASGYAPVPRAALVLPHDDFVNTRENEEFEDPTKAPMMLTVSVEPDTLPV